MQERLNDINLVIENHPKFGSHYCRSSSSKRQELENLILKIYNASNEKVHVQIMPSGMAAISCVMETFLKRSKSDPVFIMSNELYCDTPKAINYLHKFHENMIIEFVDIRKIASVVDIVEKYKENEILLYFESCSNPSGQVPNYDVIKELKNTNPNLTICVDNTWLTGHSFNPLSRDADIVIESMTKYISAGKCIGGFIMGNNDFMYDVREWIRIFGQYVGKDHCQIFIDGINTMKQRIIESSNITLDVAKYLESNDKVKRVMYPFLDSHPTYKEAVKYLLIPPSCIWFNIKHENKKNSVKYKILKNNNFIKCETSFGSSYAKIDPWPIFGSPNIYDDHCLAEQDNCQKNNNHIWIRLSVGYNSKTDDLIERLEHLIEIL